MCIGARCGCFLSTEQPTCRVCSGRGDSISDRVVNRLRDSGRCGPTFSSNKRGTEQRVGATRLCRISSSKFFPKLRPLVVVWACGYAWNGVILDQFGNLCKFTVTGEARPLWTAVSTQQRAEGTREIGAIADCFAMGLGAGGMCQTNDIPATRQSRSTRDSFSIYMTPSLAKFAQAWSRVTSAEPAGDLLLSRGQEI